jgi:hypothetical protein
MIRPALSRYRTLGWSSTKAAPRERGSLTVWFNTDMAWHAAPLGKRGRHQNLSDAAILRA